MQKVIDEFQNRELSPQAQQSVTPWGPGRITNRVHDMATSIWRDGELFLRKFTSLKWPCHSGTDLRLRRIIQSKQSPPEA